MLRVRPSIVFCDDEFAPMVDEIRPRLPAVRRWVSLQDSRRAGWTTFDAFRAEAPNAELPWRASPDDIACLLFTSGTTGAAKCCAVGQRELCRVALTMNAEMRCGSDDRGLINMPMFHFGAQGIIAGLHARGGAIVLQEHFDAAQAVALAEAERVTVLHLAPVMLQALLDEIGEHRTLLDVRTVVYSAAPMTAATLRQALKTLPGAGFLNLYGQTEAIVSGLPPEFHPRDGSGAPHALQSVGFPFPGVSVRIVDDNGRDVPPCAAGEVLVQSDSLFRRYWDDDAATLATLRDGWCHTGDIGRMDERGLLYLVDRKKDIIITGGENVYCPEVEDAVREVRGVAACAVIGTPDPRWGETVCAVVVAHHGTDPTLEDIQSAVRNRLAAFKVPRRLVVMDALPVLPTGKVDKKKLRADLMAEGRSG